MFSSLESQFFFLLLRSQVFSSRFSGDAPVYCIDEGGATGASFLFFPSLLLRVVSREGGSKIILFF